MCSIYVLFDVESLILEEKKLLLCPVQLGDWSWVPVLLCGVPVGLRMEVKHVESHLLQTIVVAQLGMMQVRVA